MLTRGEHQERCGAQDRRRPRPDARPLGRGAGRIARRAARAASDLSTGVWVFGYGSLIWNPAFHFTDRVVGTVYGFHRRFCLWTHLGRGCPERPGLVLGLERGGSCRGVAYHIAPDAAMEELDIVWRREMLSDAYVPRWVAVRTPMATVRAITFTINHAHERYARDLSDDEAAAAIAGASGFLGPAPTT